MGKNGGFWLSWASLVLGVILGVPPLVLLLKDASTATLSLVLLLSCALLVLGAWLYWSFKTPPWTILKADYKLTLADTEGRTASLRKSILLRSNSSGGNQRYVHKRIASDGKVTPKIDPRMKLVEFRRNMGEHELELEFPTPIGFLGRSEHWIELSAQDSFLGEREALQISVDEPTHAIDLEILFPEQRHPKQAWGIYRGSGKASEIEPLFSGDGKIRWACSRKFPSLRSGSYEIWWRW